MGMRRKAVKGGETKLKTDQRKVKVDKNKNKVDKNKNVEGKASNMNSSTNGKDLKTVRRKTRESKVGKKTAGNDVEVYEKIQSVRCKKTENIKGKISKKVSVNKLEDEYAKLQQKYKAMEKEY